MRTRTFGTVTVGIVLLAGAAVAADFFGLLGTRRQAFVDYVDVRFAPVNQASGRPVTDVHLNCFRKGSKHACSERAARDRKTVHADFGAVMVRTRSWLFTKGTAPADPAMRVYVMFIHPDYERVVRTFTVADLLRLRGRTVNVEMPRAGQ